MAETIIDKSEFINIYLIKKYLGDRGYTYRDIRLGGLRHTLFTSPGGRTWVTRSGMVTYPFVSLSALRISIFKNRGYDLARELGVNFPFSQVVHKGDTIAADDLFSRYTRFVVKPDDASRSHGVTIGITEPAALAAALEDAYAYSDDALIQEHVEGEEIRFTFVDGVMHSALIRKKPSVTGDGTLTVRELIARENVSRATLDLEYVDYPQLDESMVYADAWVSDDVVPAGEERRIGDGTMIKTGASIYNITDLIDRSYVDHAEKLARPLGSGCVVADFFITDYTVPATPQNYWFNELNMSPSIRLYYGCRDGNHPDYLGVLIPKLDATING